MQAESLEVLEKAEVPPAQARAFVRAIEIEIAGAQHEVATKSDVVLVRSDLRQEMAELRAELRQEMAELRADLRQEMAGLRADLRQEMAELRAEIHEKMSALRAELKGDMAKLEARLEGLIHQSASNIARQMHAALLGQTAVLLGFTYFFATYVR